MENKKQSHHRQNYLIDFCIASQTRKRALVNAIDTKNALRIGLARLCRAYPLENITRARVAGVYENGKKRIGKRIGVNMDFDQ